MTEELPALTKREREVLPLVAQGFMNKEIAAKLGFSTRTAKFYVSALLKRFNCRDRRALACAACKMLGLQGGRIP